MDSVSHEPWVYSTTLFNKNKTLEYQFELNRNGIEEKMETANLP